MGEAVERLFLPLVKKTIPEIVRHAPSRRGHLPQPDDRRDRQALSRARPQDDARDLGNGADDVHQDRSSSWTPTSTSASARKLLWRALTAIDPERDIEIVRGPGRRARLRRRGCRATGASSAWTPRASGRRRGSTGAGRTRSRCRPRCDEDRRALAVARDPDSRAAEAAGVESPSCHEGPASSTPTATPATLCGARSPRPAARCACSRSRPRRTGAAPSSLPTSSSRRSTSRRCAPVL